MDDVWKGLTLLIGGGVGYVAYQQFSLARERFKLDLFEKRFTVFAAARTLLSVVLRDADAPLDRVFEYRAAVGHATFLFDSDITSYLDEIDRKAVRLHFTMQRMAERPVVADHHKVIEENHQLLTWLTDQLPELKGRFEPYLKFRTWK